MLCKVAEFPNESSLTDIKPYTNYEGLKISQLTKINSKHEIHIWTNEILTS